MTPKTHLPVSLLLSLILGASCLAQRKPIPDDTLITLERTVCYGPCPIYKLTVTAEGTVTFEGRENVKVKGIVKGRISLDDLRNLIAAFEAASYFSLNDKYETRQDGCPEVKTDKPYAITSIRMNGKTKTISHYYGCQMGVGTIYPNGLTFLEAKIDQIVGTDKWVKEPPPNQVVGRERRERVSQLDSSGEAGVVARRPVNNVMTLMS